MFFSKNCVRIWMMKKVGKDGEVCCVKVSDGEIVFRKTDELRW